MHFRCQLRSCRPLVDPAYVQRDIMVKTGDGVVAIVIVGKI